MPVLKTNTITNAKFGNTDLSAVYMGSTQIYKAQSDPPTPEGHIAANAINLECKFGLEDHGAGAAMYGRFYFLLPYESLYGTDNLRPSSRIYHPNQCVCEIYDTTTKDTLWQFTGWIEAYNRASPLGSDSVCDVDGLKYTRCCVPPIGSDVSNPDPGILFPASNRISLKIKVVVPYYDDNPTFPVTEDMYSRELTINNDNSGDFIYSFDLPSPAYSRWD